MKLSTRVRYGVRAMIELAKQKDGKPVALRKVAQRQGISAKYLEQMATALKTSGIIESVRGAEGGYRLTRAASEISVLDIYNVLNVTEDQVDCVANHCPRRDYCSARDVWEEMTQSIQKVLGSKTLQQLANREIRQEKAYHDGI